MLSRTQTCLHNRKGNVSMIVLVSSGMVAFLLVAIFAFYLAKRNMLLHFFAHRDAQTFIANHPTVIETLGSVVDWDSWPAGEFSYGKYGGQGWLRMEVTGSRDRAEISLQLSGDSPEYWYIDKAVLHQEGFQIPINLETPRHWWNMLEQYLRWGKLEEATKICDLFNVVLPRYSYSRRCTAEIALARGDQKNYIDIYKSILDKDQKYFRHHQQLGDAYAKTGQKEKSLEHYTIAWRLHPDPIIAGSIGVAYMGLERYEEAKSFLDKAVKDNRATPIVMTMYGFYYWVKKDYSKATEMHKKALAMNPNWAEAYLGLAAVATALNEPHQAILYYEQALTRMPAGMLQHRLALVDILESLESYESLIYHLLKAVEYHPDHYPLYEKLAHAYERKGYYHKARATRKLWKIVNKQGNQNKR